MNTTTLTTVRYVVVFFSLKETFDYFMNTISLSCIRWEQKAGKVSGTKKKQLEEHVAAI